MIAHDLADLADLLTTAGLDWTPSRRSGVPTIILDGAVIRIIEGDGRYFLYLMEGRAEAIHTQAEFSGPLAQVALLATIDALRGGWAA